MPPSHGENRGSSPLGSANKINGLFGGCASNVGAVRKICGKDVPERSRIKRASFAAIFVLAWGLMTTLGRSGLLVEPPGHLRCPTNGTILGAQRRRGSAVFSKSATNPPLGTRSYLFRSRGAKGGSRCIGRPVRWLPADFFRNLQNHLTIQCGSCSKIVPIGDFLDPAKSVPSQPGLRRRRPPRRSD
jgi:hypothetical protein